MEPSWTSTDEFESAIQKLNLETNVVSKLNKTDNQQLYFNLLDHFVVGRDRRWWWEAFKSSFRIETDGYVLDHLNRIMPNLSQKVWLMIEDNYKPYYPIYNIEPTAIIELISESAAEFEYYIISKDLNWLICEAHTGDVFGVGEQLKAHLSSLYL